MGYLDQVSSGDIHSPEGRPATNHLDLSLSRVREDWEQRDRRDQRGPYQATAKAVTCKPPAAAQKYPEAPSERGLFVGVMRAAMPLIGGSPAASPSIPDLILGLATHTGRCRRVGIGQSCSHLRLAP
ncbi:hypothetical protein E2C01_099234 [Portunus trituberculatus]|uniref:Uncharacterized protein n=1 Tax=Portunus trituberculatus TaxID=210409 RepID=A0A5B7K4Z1_PORTR|nr:hypothetical protein [Portunus trituberculatus]